MSSKSKKTSCINGEHGFLTLTGNSLIAIRRRFDDNPITPKLTKNRNKKRKKKHK